MILRSYVMMIPRLPIYQKDDHKHVIQYFFSIVTGCFPHYRDIPISLRELSRVLWLQKP